MNTRPLSQRLIACLLAGLVCGETFRRVGDKFLTPYIPGLVILGLSVAILLACLTGAFNKRITQAFWMGAIRYGIAFDLALFGFQKFYDMQFVVPLGMLDESFSDLSRMWLMWAFFGRSPGFIITIAITQIIGSCLLVFNRTRLLGAIVLIPVMINIIFLDYFYELELGVLAHALIIFAGLVQLLMLDYKRLVDFFFKDRSNEGLSIRMKSVFLKYFARLSIIFGPLLLVATYDQTDKHSDLKGKYDVTDMKVNGREAIVTSCADSLLSLVYLDRGDELVFEYNSLKRRTIGHYELDKETMSASWHYPPSAEKKEFKGTLKKINDSTLQIAGFMNGDSIRASLRKQKL
jgi:hypothetical protein